MAIAGICQDEPPLSVFVYSGISDIVDIFSSPIQVNHSNFRMAALSGCQMLYMIPLCASELPQADGGGGGSKYLPNGQLLSLPVGAGSTRSCYLYAGGNFGDEFLRSASIFHYYAGLPQVSVELSGGLEMNAGEAKAAGGFDIGKDVVNVDRFLGPGFARPECLPVD